MQTKTLQMKRALHTALLVLLLSALGMGKLSAQDFTVGDLNYTINDDGTSVTVIGHAYGMWASGELVIPETVREWEGSPMLYEVTAIADSAFWNCTELVGDLVIPNSVTSIGQYAFGNCAGFSGILSIGHSVTTIGNGAFSSCQQLSGNLIIPNSVLSIGDYAFQYCWSFTGDLTIPDSVLSIGDNAFDGCEGFTGALTIGNAVTTVGSEAFSGCIGFTGTLALGNSITTIGAYAFSYCEGLSGTLVLPNSLIIIGGNSFTYCGGFTGDLVIPNAVTLIGNHAFDGCDGLSSVSIPSSVTSIEGNPFMSCKGIEQISIASGNMVYDSRNECNGIVETATNSLIAGCKNTVIPNTVRSIEDDAFNGMGLFSMMIPNSVTTIGVSAFAGNEEMIAISLPDALVTIREYAFNGCYGLTSLVIPSATTSIGEGILAFCLNIEQIVVETNNPVFDSRNNCNAIIETSTNVLCVGCKNTTIPNSVTSIGDRAFSGCSGLTSFIIPNSVTSIESCAFLGCKGLTSVTIGSSVITIGHGAFQNCIGLNSITIPNSVTSIADYAFSECNMTSVTIGTSVTTIGYGAFLSFTTNLEEVIALVSEPSSLNGNPFGYCENLIVCCGNKETYESSDWAYYVGNIEEDCNPHEVIIDENNILGGLISSSVTSTEMGDDVQLTITPDDGMSLSSLTISNANDPSQTVPFYPVGKSVSVYGFVMPPFDVVVTAVFAPISSVDENTTIEVLVYPNPTRNQVIIEAENLRRTTINNMLGQQFFNGNITGDAFEYDFGQYGAGVYLVSIETSEGVATKRVVVTQ